MNSTAPNNREKEIFEQALDLASDAERLAFVRGACGGDAPLCARVLALLAAHETDAGFLPDLPEAATVDLPVTAKAGDRIGRYKLREKIGEGGCGLVYVAEQEEPVRRKVALKVIKLGMDTREVVARFEAERQALAMMDHPNIAKVFDAGATDTGRPFFVMELVRGIRITDYCDQNKLATAERLDLFIQVCHAIQHAHQKGIIHRDIKPSNVLVTLHDGVPVPKVIDFGIAKAMEQKLTEKTLYTAFEQFVGTPAYTSPEQAEMSGLDIDTRSDIYALGVLLYELLTGKTPFDGQQLLAAGLEEMRRTIREKEPVRPSTRLRTMLNGDLTTTAQHRRTEAPKLIHLLRGDLDWIVMKCLEKDRTRRYDTANGLALDIERHLTHEPVAARPPSTAYRAQKFVRRNKVMVAAGSMVAAALVLGIMVSTWQAVRAGRQRARAEANEQKALAAEAKEVEQRQRAEEARRQAQAQAYASDMKAAQMALQEDNRGMAVHLLRRYLPEVGEEDLRGLEWRYLWQESQGDEIRTFNHAPMTGTAVLSPDGRYLVTAANDERTVVWEAASGKRVREFDGAPIGSAKREAAAFSPDGKWLAMLGQSGVEIRNTTDWAVVQVLRSAGRPFRFSPSGKRFVASGTNGVAVWDVGDWSHRALTNVHVRWGTLAVTFDADQVAAAQPHNPLIRWSDLRTGTTAILQVGPNVNALGISPDGKWLASAHYGGEVCLWEAATLQLVHRLQMSQGFTYGLAFSPDSRLLATGGADQLIRIWQTGTTNKVAELKGHQNQIWSLEFSRDGQSLVSSSKEGTAKLWNLTLGPPKSRILNLPANVELVGPLPDNRTLVTADWEQRVTQLWSLPEGRLTGAFGWQEVNRLCNSNHAHFVANDAVVGVGTNGTVHFWSLSKGGLHHSVALGGGQFYPVELSPDNRWLIGVLSAQSAVLFDLRTTRRVPLPRWWGCWAFSPDCRWLAFPGTTNRAIKIWDLEGGRERVTIQGHNWQIQALRFSPDSKLLASASWDNDVGLWSVEQGGLVHGLLRGHQAGAWQVRFSSDGRTLMTGSDDLTMRWWSVATGQEMLRFQNVHRNLFWNIGDRLLVWQDTQGSNHVTTLPTLAEIDAVEAQQSRTAQTH